MEKARRTPDEIGIEQPRPWRRTWYARVLRWLVVLGALALLAWEVRAVTAVVGNGRDLFGWNIDRACADSGLSCGALTGFVLPVLSLALATALFLIRRLWMVPRQRRKVSLTAPHELVPTAGAIAGQVVGRDELCKVVMDSLQLRDERRPQLIMGGVGTGKTAVVVQLTRLLAQYDATPVAIRLRDVPRGFRFNDVASDQFQRQIHRRVLSGAEGDRIWRYLRQEDRIVVLADGLEEALSQEADRDDLIRLAIAQARADDLPLVITSRPHDSLRGMDASILELEPMSEEAALQYLGDGDAHGDPRRLDWIVETAGVAEAPLYLRIAHELSRERLLSHLVTDDDDEPGGKVNTRDLDRSALRRNLLDTWRTELARGRLQGHLPLSPYQRRATLAFVSALACVGLQHDRLEVEYTEALEDDGKGDRKRRPGARAAPDEDLQPVDGEIPAAMTWLPDRFQNRQLMHWVARQMPELRQLRGVVDARLAAIWAGQLGLVEVRGKAVRFQHSVLQAYLGSWALEGVFTSRAASEKFLQEAFTGSQRPGREMLIALVLFSRHLAAERMTGGATALSAMAGESATSAWIVHFLAQQAAEHHDSKGLDILAAALEIDAVVDEPRQQHVLAETAADRWMDFRASDLRTLEEAKLGFVYRFGEALREVDRRSRWRPADGPQRENLYRGYRALFTIGWRESVSYPVRHAVAQELGAGGLTAFRALREEFNGALHALDTDAWRRKEETWRKVVMSAWLAPLLLGGPPKEPSPHHRGADEALRRENLWRWMGRVGKEQVRDRWSGDDGHQESERARAGAPGTAGAFPASGASAAAEGAAAGRPEPWQVARNVPVPALPISIEVALAQGFKYAANRRERHPRAQVEGRTYLAEQALELLKRSRFWFSQLTLLQALGLWALPDNPVGEGSRIPGPSNTGVYGPDIEARVRHWVEVAGSLRDVGREPNTSSANARRSRTAPHPFVVETGELVIRALKTGRPERFMWIDEHGVTSKIGASAINRAELRKHHLWIPPSIGWSALHRRAQVLVAEVLLLMNLADRGEGARDREERLRRADRPELPPCLTRDRHTLDPNREIGVLEDSRPGNNCPGECEFDLCPYPPKGRVNYHAELTEAFCRRQQTLLRLGHRRRPWQAMLPGELRRFWGEMATRARR
jgi:hypothetical protein